MNNDLISRKALKKALIEAHINRVLTFDIATFNCVMNTIDNAPTVDITCPHCDSGYAQDLSDGYLNGKEERPHGKWIKIFSNPFVDGYVCPFCGHKIQVTEQFIPQVTECEVCGADMRGEDNEH